MLDLAYELKKCKECSCSRCTYNGTEACYIEIAIKELGRYERLLFQECKPRVSAEA